MKNTQFKVEYVFGDIMSTGSVPPEQTPKLITFPAKIM